MREKKNVIVAFISSLVSASIALWILRNPGKIQKWVSVIKGFFSWIKKDVATTLNLWRLEREVQNTINEGLRCINNESNGALPYRLDLRISRTDPEDPEDISVVVTDSIVKVVADQDENTPEQLVQIIIKSVEHMLIPSLRRFLGNDLVWGIDLTVARRIVKHTSKQGAMSCFETALASKIAACPSVEPLYNAMVGLDERGWFTRIFLYILNDLQKKTQMKTSAKYMDSEVRSLIRFLHNIASRDTGRKTPLEFVSEHIKIIVLLVGAITTRIRGIAPYLRRIRKSLSKGVEIIYIVAVGEENVKTAKKVAQYQFEAARCNCGLKTYYRSIFEGKPVLCALLVRDSREREVE